MSGEPYIVVPLLTKYVREHLDYILVRDNGKHGLLKYVYENGCYRLYSSDMLMGVIKRFIATYDEELVKMSKVTETLQHITTDLNYVSQDDLDTDENLINFENGLLRVTDTEIKLMPHTPTVYSTIQIPCSWTGKSEPTPVFDAYMCTLTNGNKAIEQLLLEFIGVCISNIKGWRLKKSLFLVGDGDTGKSQLKSLVERLLGKGNFIGIDLKEIEARFGTGAIYGTRLAGSSDMSFLNVDELKTFKKITGGDSLYAEFKGQQAFEFTYNGLLWFCMNHLPRFGGDNGQWGYDHIMVVHCPNVIPKEKQDKQLFDKMYAERDGIVYKVIRALQTVIGNGYCFVEPESVSAARSQYMSENSTVISFFEECMASWPDGKINRHCTTGRIYRVYQAWCRDNNNGFAKDCDDPAQWVPENGNIPIYDGMEDFTRFAVEAYKLAVFVKLNDSFIHDASFSIEDHLTSRFAKNFAKAEDKGFLIGTGEHMPTGILSPTDGAEIGVHADSITFDDVLRLYFSLDKEYRKNAVWLMNDETSLALRLLKDNNGNYLWNLANDRILSKRVFISNDMPSANAGEMPIVFGDFSYYWIIDRSSVSIQTLKEKFVTLDQVGYLATEFLDGKLIRRKAIKALKITAEVFEG